MDVLIAGGHGQIARRLIRLLARDGHTARGLIRNPDHAADIEADGGVAVQCDLEREDVTPHVRGADAIVFAAGAGPGSGPERKRTVDYAAAVKCVDAAEAGGVGRFVIVSSIGAQDPDGGPEAMRPYLRAKAEADARVAASSLDWTIVRPGSLHDDPGTGRVEATTALGSRGPVPRDDVALVLAETLQAPSTVHLTFEVFAGDTPVREALRNLQPTPNV
jgi:uncharacterized protein YbjT (DUF2867 family)